MSDDVLRPAAVAAFLGVDVETVRRWLAEGRIPGRKIGSGWFTLRSELEAAITSQHEEAPDARRGIDLPPGGRPLAGPGEHRGTQPASIPDAHRAHRPEALAALDELKADRRAGLAGGRTATGAFLERWVEHARNIRPTTRAGYRAVVTYHLAPALGPIPLADLRPAHIEELLLALEGRLAPKSARNVLVVLRRALGQAVRSRLIGVNYAGPDFVDAPRVVLEEPDAFTATEVTALLSAVRGDRLEALYVTAVGTGLRQGELLGLAWQDIDGMLPGGASGIEPARRLRNVGARDEVGQSTDDSPLRPHLRVRFELARVDGVYRRVEPKTDRSRRSVPLSPAVVAALRAHRQRVIDEGFVPTATGPVFTSRSGGPLNGSWLTHHSQALYRAAGIRPLDFKALRATFASRLYEAGVSDLEIAQLLGHTRTHTTRRHYIALAGGHASALEAIEQMVG